jgi:hypothetical protein
MAGQLYKRFKMVGEGDDRYWWVDRYGDDGIAGWERDVIDGALDDIGSSEFTMDKLHDLLAAAADCETDPEDTYYSQADEIRERFYEEETDVYNSDLLEWVSEDLSNASYVEDAMGEFGCEGRDFFELVGLGQHVWIQQLGEALLDALVEAAEGLDDLCFSDEEDLYSDGFWLGNDWLEAFDLDYEDPDSYDLEEAKGKAMDLAKEEARIVIVLDKCGGFVWGTWYHDNEFWDVTEEDCVNVHNLDDSEDDEERRDNVSALLQKAYENYPDAMKRMEGNRKLEDLKLMAMLEQWEQNDADKKDSQDDGTTDGVVSLTGLL